MSQSIKYVHTNIIAQNWKKLAHFYENVFDCKRLLPERDLKGDWIESGTGVPDVHIKGVHLRLPGYEGDGPTLEIFQYNRSVDSVGKEVNRIGFSHIAFRVNDVHEYLAKIIENGGKPYGETVSAEVAGSGFLTFVYANDPEGNIIELQKWE